MTVEITCECDLLTYRRINKDSAGNDDPGPEHTKNRGEVLTIDVPQTIELINKGPAIRVAMRNTGESDVRWKYVGNTPSTLPPGGVVKIDRALTLVFIDVPASVQAAPASAGEAAASASAASHSPYQPYETSGSEPSYFEAD